MAEGGCASYFALSSVFNTQKTPYYCGLASLAMILNSLEVDPRRVWKGIWRWFDEELLDCCVPLEKVLKEGTSLDQVACLARCNGVRCTLHRPPPTLWRDEALANRAATLEFEDGAALQAWIAEFRAAVVAQCTDRSAPRIIVAYDRRALAQVGTGHFSPVGAYHRASDSVLVLDVARFKYPPHWCPVEVLARSCLFIDSSTRKARGFLVIARHADERALSPAVAFARYKAVVTLALECVAARVVDDAASDADAVVLDVGVALETSPLVAELFATFIALAPSATQCCAAAAAAAATVVDPLLSKSTTTAHCASTPTSTGAVCEPTSACCSVKSTRANSDTSGACCAATTSARADANDDDARLIDNAVVRSELTTRRLLERAAQLPLYAALARRANVESSDGTGVDDSERQLRRQRLAFIAMLLLSQSRRIDLLLKSQSSLLKRDSCCNCVDDEVSSEIARLEKLVDKLFDSSAELKE